MRNKHTKGIAKMIFISTLQYYDIRIKIKKQNTVNAKYYI